MSSPASTRFGRLSDVVLPPAASIRLRALGLHPGAAGAPRPRRWMALVPPQRPAVDIGAHRGLWSYWLSRHASGVHAFEPNPDLYAFLSKTHVRGVQTYPVALSDREGSAELSLPRGGRPGRGSIEPAAEGRTAVATVPTRCLDTYELADVGFVKIDVEGHEEAVLRGATETLTRSHPTLYMEIEERHNAGGTSRIPASLAELGYAHAYFVLDEALHPLAEFDLPRHQPDIGETWSPHRAVDFVFAATPLTT